MALTPSYLLRRFGLLVLTIWIGATVMFFIPRLAPGDPTEAIITRMIARGEFVENADQMIAAWRERFGLDKPLGVQYLVYMRNMVMLDMGYSLTQFPTQVNDLIQRSLPWTVGLLVTATLISFLLGNTIGTLIGWRRTPRLLRSLLPISLIFTSVPFYMLGILLIYLFAVLVRWFPIFGSYSIGISVGWNWPFIKSVIHHSVLPAGAIVLASMGFWALGMRGMMITTAGEDYMLLATAKGLRPSRILFRYAVRNAILPQVTSLSLSIAGVAGGSMLVEYLFSYPGMGYLLNLAITGNDYTLLQGIVFMTIAGTSLAAFLIDILYPILDPRITYERR